jgi:hypothetical protein
MRVPVRVLRLCMASVAIEAAFRENEITEKVLPSLTAEDLKEIGVGPVGRRAMARLKA